jgi:hypothetical protein
MLGLYHGANVAGATFPSEIWHTYMEAAKGKFCGDFPPPKTPFTSQPFFGKYTASGGKGNPTEGGDESFTEPAPTGTAIPDDTEEDTGGTKPGNGNGNGNGNANGNDNGADGFDPEKYEAPPQPSPSDGDGTGVGGGTEAPPG